MFPAQSIQLTFRGRSVQRLPNGVCRPEIERPKINSLIGRIVRSMEGKTNEAPLLPETMLQEKSVADAASDALIILFKFF